MYCPKCKTANALENKFCSRQGCAYPLTVERHAEVSLVKRLQNVEAQLQDARLRLVSHANLLPISKDKLKEVRANTRDEEYDKIRQIVEAVLKEWK